MGADINNSRYIRFENTEFVGSKTASSACYGINMNSGATSPWACIFNGCLFTGNLYGAVVYGQDHVFGGCIFNYNGAYLGYAASGYDIGLNSGVTKTIINGCLFDNTIQPPSPTTGGVTYSIGIFSGANYNLVANNIYHTALLNSGAGNLVTNNLGPI